MSAVDYAAIKTAVVQWVTDVAGSYLGTDANGDPFIFWHEDAHANMGEPHAALKLTDGGRQGMDAVDWVEDVGARTLAPRVRGNPLGRKHESELVTFRAVATNYEIGEIGGIH